MLKKRILGLFLLSFACMSSVSATTYTVSKQDSLYKISIQYGVSIADIQKENQLKSDKLRVGQVLKLPSKSKVTKTVSKDKNNSMQKKKIEGFLPIEQEVAYSSREWKRVNANLTDRSAVIAYNRTPRESRSETTNGDVRKLLGIMDELIDIPYKSGGTTVEGFDCSGFTSYVFDQLGVTLPRQSSDQFQIGEEIEQEQLKPGDLLFFDSMKKGMVTHVGVYVGENKMIHSGNTKVEVDGLNWYFSHYTYYGAKRVMQFSGS